MATVTMIVTEQVVPNTPDHVEEIAILLPQVLTQIQPQIAECPVLMPQVMVPESARGRFHRVRGRPRRGNLAG